MHDVLLSTAGPRDLPERQQTINATVAWSYQLLAANEQRLFRRLRVLPGRFPIEAAAAVLAGRKDSSPASDEAICAAAGLIDERLLLRRETSVASRPLYDMLDTVRAYAALELTMAGERDDAPCRRSIRITNYGDQARLVTDFWFGEKSRMRLVESNRYLPKSP